MTTIIGIQKDDHCIIAADSRTTAGDRPYSHPTVTKITKRGRWLIAGAGDVQPCDVIQHIWKPPALPTTKRDLYSFMITEVTPSLRDCIKSSGYMPEKEDANAGFEFLLAINGTIYQVDDSYSVYLRDDGLYGIGSGSAWAIGALAQGAAWKKALQIAAKNDVYTAPPFIMQKQEKVI
jgi:ATP-dependent protease HslVU (ClpYQ) peptidase subunit